jgi:hypothetical protein
MKKLTKNQQQAIKEIEAKVSEVCDANNTIEVTRNEDGVIVNRKTGEPHFPELFEKNNQPREIEISLTFDKSAPTLKKQLNTHEAEKLWNEIDHQVLGAVIASMENKADLNKKYVSVYLTILRWSENQKKYNNGKTNSNSSENRFADLEQQLERSLQGTKLDI